MGLDERGVGLWDWMEDWGLLTSRRVSLYGKSMVGVWDSELGWEVGLVRASTMGAREGEHKGSLLSSEPLGHQASLKRSL